MEVQPGDAGAASGIGRAVAHRMAEAGAELELVDRDPERLSATVEALEPYGQRVEAHVVDLADPSAIEALWEALGEPLINNAAVYPSRPFTEVDEAFYRRVMGVNLEGTLWMCRRMIQARGAQGGVIINIGSIGALLPFKADLSVYSTSKAAVIALTRALAREYGRRGFRINALLFFGPASSSTRDFRSDGRPARTRSPAWCWSWRATWPPTCTGP